MSKQVVGRIAGTALSGKSVSDFLHFHIGQASILQLDYNIRIQQGGFRTKTDGIIGKNLSNFDLSVQQERKELFEPSGSGFRIEDFFENAVIKDLDALCSGTVVQKELLFGNTPLLEDEGELVLGGNDVECLLTRTNAWEKLCEGFVMSVSDL